MNFKIGDRVDLKVRANSDRAAPGTVVDIKQDNLVVVHWDPKYRDGIESTFSYRPDQLIGVQG